MKLSIPWNKNIINKGSSESDIFKIIFENNKLQWFFIREEENKTTLYNVYNVLMSFIDGSRILLDK